NSLECLAAALQDHGRAVIMGERTRGSLGITTLHIVKQNDTRAALKITTAVVCRPSGKNLSKLLTSGREDEDWGVIPDKGFALALPPAEREQLRQHFHAVELIPCRDPGAAQPVALF